MKPNFSAKINYYAAILNIIIFVYGLMIQDFTCLMNLTCSCINLYFAYLCDKEYAKYLLNKLKVWLQK